MNNKLTNIAFLGPKGSYSYFAAKLYIQNYKKKIKEHSCNNFKDIVNYVKSKNVKYGILPIENSSSGAIHEVCDMLCTTNLYLVGEISIPIEHSILVNGKTLLHQINNIYSHPQPFKQCSKFLLKNFPQWKIHYCNSTAIAMKIVSSIKKQPSTIAALGSTYGGIFYGLQPLIKYNKLTNKQKNTTRFIIISHQPFVYEEEIPKDMMLIIEFIKKNNDNVNKMTSLINDKKIIITNCISYTSQHNTQKKTFLINVETTLNKKQIKNILMSKKQNIQISKILGPYPKFFKKIENLDITKINKI